MLRESMAMLLVGVLLLGAFLRSKHYGYALAIAPISTTPFVHLLFAGILYFSGNSFFGIRPAVATAFVDLMGVIGGCVFVMLFGQHIRSKRNRWVYQLVMYLYILVIGWVYIYHAIML